LVIDNEEDWHEIILLDKLNLKSVVLQFAKGLHKQIKQFLSPYIKAGDILITKNIPLYIPVNSMCDLRIIATVKKISKNSNSSDDDNTHNDKCLVM